jgi:hypothetical protein
MSRMPYSLLGASLVAAASCHALSPVKFTSNFSLKFERQGVALSSEERTRLDEHLARMAQRRECNLEVVILAVGSRPQLDADMTGKPVTERERYLADLMARRSIRRTYFASARETDASGVARDEAKMELVGAPSQQGCTVSGE